MVVNLYYYIGWLVDKIKLLVLFKVGLVVEKCEVIEILGIFWCGLIMVYFLNWW